jgi:hypothetical protein
MQDYVADLQDHDLFSMIYPYLYRPNKLPSC